ncbi:hypothetical protein [Pseudonocardia sp. NPDC049635]|uniref:hypothetical protein n=1 Tax=Pseudonocardia sp. NPDC049635 TaxID=3155506 RepID=UPI0033F6A374
MLGSGEVPQEATLPDGPPWLVALAILAGVLTTTAAWWGPALARKAKGQPSGGEGATTSATPEPGPQRPIERVDAQMALIEKMLDNVEREQERDREAASVLREENRKLAARVARLEAEVASRDRTIEHLHRLLAQYQPPPRWPPPPPTGPAR